MDEELEDDARSLARLLAFAKLEAVRLDLWDAVYAITDALRSIGEEPDSAGLQVPERSTATGSAAKTWFKID